MKNFYSKCKKWKNYEVLARWNFCNAKYTKLQSFVCRIQTIGVLTGPAAPVVWPDKHLVNQLACLVNDRTALTGQLKNCSYWSTIEVLFLV